MPVAPPGPCRLLHWTNLVAGSPLTVTRRVAPLAGGAGDASRYVLRRLLQPLLG
jgi:hypothetical protein